MVESIGLRAVLDLSQWDRATKSYDAAIGFMRTATIGFATDAARALGQFFASSVKEGREFTKAISNVAAVANLERTDKLFQDLTDSARQLGRTTKFTASEAAEGMGFLAMAGFEAQEIIQAMPGTLNLAAASNLELGKSADIVSNILTAFGNSAESTGRFVDVLTKTFTTSNTNLTQLGQAMKFAAPTAASLGFEVEDAAAAIAKLGDAGIQGALAGTSLRGILLSLASPTNKAQTEFDKLGISIFDSEGKMKALPQVVGDINRALAGMTQQQQAATLKNIVGTRQFSAFQVLLRTGQGELERYGATLRDSVGTASDVAAKQLDNLEGDLTLFNSALSGLKLETFDLMEDGLRRVVQAGTELTTWATGSISTWDSVLTGITNINQALDASATNMTDAAEQASFFEKFQQGANAALEAQVQVYAQQALGLAKLVVGEEELQQAAMKAFPPIEEQSDALENTGKASEDAASSLDLIASANALLQSDVASTVSTFEEYETAAQKLIAADETLAESLNITQEQFANLKFEAAEASRAITETARANAEAAGFFIPKTNRELDAYKQMAQARAGFTETQSDFAKKTEQERIETQRKEEAKLAKESAKVFEQSFDSAADNIRSTIESVIKPSLSEVWTPPEAGGEHFDEAARRLATVATSGFGSEWLNQLNQQFAGQDFFEPIRQAMASGNEAALQEAATNILTTQVEKLWDVEMIKNQVRQQLQADNLRQQLIDLVQEEMNAEGVTTTFTGIQTQADQAETGVDDLSKAMEEAEDSTEFFTDALGEGLGSASEQIISFGEAVESGEWPEVGESVVLGIDKGIKDNLEVVRETLKGLARKAVEDVARELGIKSPSTVMMNLMEDFVEGGIVGLDKKSPEFRSALDQLFSIDRSITDPLNAAGAAFDEVERLLEHGGLGISRPKAGLILGVAKNVIKRDIDQIVKLGEQGGKAREQFIARQIQMAISNWEDAGIKMTDSLASRIADVFENNFDIAQRENEALLQEMFRDGAREAVQFGQTLLGVANQSVAKFNSDIAMLADLVNSGVTDIQWAGQMLTAAEAADTLNQMLEERRNLQDDLNDLQRSQQQLAFLDQQLALLDRIDEAGLDASEILGGIGLGLDASTEDIVAATNAVIQAMIEQVNSDLGIASPSKVMIDKFHQVGLGMAEGLMSTLPQIGQAMGTISSMLQGSLVGGTSINNTTYNNDVTINTGASARATVGQLAIQMGMVS